MLRNNLLSEILGTASREGGTLPDLINTVHVYFDVSNIFNGVFHQDLVAEYCDVEVALFGVTWIQSFLQNRSFVVIVKNMMSKQKRLEGRFPPSSALLPLLYSLYIHECPTLPQLIRLFIQMMSSSTQSRFMVRPL